MTHARRPTMTSSSPPPWPTGRCLTGSDARGCSWCVNSHSTAARGWLLRACARPPKGPAWGRGRGPEIGQRPGVDRPTVREGGRVLVVMGATDRPTAQAQPTYPRPGEDRLYEEMKARIRYLEEQVEEEREARRRADTLLARLMERLPELEAAPEARGAPETAAPDTQRGEPRGGATDAERAGERRPWWQRWFGG